MLGVGLEATTTVFERAKTVHALDLSATLIGPNLKDYPVICVEGLWNTTQLSFVGIIRHWFERSTYRIQMWNCNATLICSVSSSVKFSDATITAANKVFRRTVVFNFRIRDKCTTRTRVQHNEHELYLLCFEVCRRVVRSKFTVVSEERTTSTSG
jgi:hypothetical protein